jgi:hypothetical protein
MHGQGVLIKDNKKIFVCERKEGKIIKYYKSDGSVVN